MADYASLIRPTGYDPTIGRYLQTDPLGFVDGPSIYAYAKSTPAMYVDHDGRFTVYGYGGGAAISGVGATISTGIGYNSISGTVDSFVSPGWGVGIDVGAGGGVGFLSGMV